MKIRNLLGLIAAVTMCGMANAGEVTTGSVTTFSAGEPAVAADVNANFEVLITAINDNAARIAALETPDNSVAGHGYTLFYSGSILAAEQGALGTVDEREYGFVEKYAGQGTITFDAAGGTGNGLARDTAGAELGIGAGTGGVFYTNGGADPADDQLTFTWTQEGNVVTVQIQGESSPLNFVVSEDGSLLVGHGTVDPDTDVFDDGKTVDISDISSIFLVRD